MNQFVSPRLGMRFEMFRGHIADYFPNGERFLSFVQLGTQAEEARQRAEAERKRAEDEHRKAEEERRKAEEASKLAAAERERAARLAARLRELGVDPDSV